MHSRIAVSGCFLTEIDAQALAFFVKILYYICINAKEADDVKPKKLKKLVSLLLSMTLLLGIAALSGASSYLLQSVGAADLTTDSGYVYTIDAIKSTAQITGYTGTAHTCTIPSDISGYKVTSLKAEAFKNKNTILSVTIPDTVTTIGSECFSGCTLLGTLNMGSGISSIGSKAFENCKILSTLDVPAATASIGSDAFYGCTSLSAVNVADGNLVYQSKDGILFDKLGTKLILYPAAHSGSTYNVSGVKQIEDYAFYGCKNLTTVETAASVTTLGKGVFKDCTALTSVALGGSLKKLEDSVFSGCKKLTSLKLPTTLVSIGESAFKGCTSIKNLTIPTGVTTVGADAFSDCTGLTTVTVTKDVTALSGAAFKGCTALSEFKVQDGGSFTVSKGVLYNKDGTRLVAYPAGNTAESFTVPDKVTAIGTYAFDSCKHLKKLIVPASVKTLAKPVIRNCNATVIYAEKSSAAQDYFKANTDGFAELKIGKDVLPGDINTDGVVDNADVILLRRYVAKWKDIQIDTDAADVNNDSTIDNADVILLRRYVAKWKNVTLK